MKKKAAWRRRGKEQARVREGSTTKGEQPAAPKQALIIVAALDGDAGCGHDSGWGSSEGVMHRIVDGCIADRKGSSTGKRA